MGIGQIFEKLLYQPIFNALVLFYEYIPFRDFGLAVILLTLAIKFVLWPLGVKAFKSQKAMAEIQPEIEEIKKKNKGNLEKQAAETMALYKSKNINLFSGFLPLLVQFPILLALYRVFIIFREGLSAEEMGLLYSFVPRIEINTSFLGLIDLVSPSLFLAVAAGIFQFLQVKWSPSAKIGASSGKKQGFAAMQKQLLYITPVFTFLILVGLPSVIGLYWVVAAAFSIFQQKIIEKYA